MGFGWILFGLSVSVDGFFVTTVLFMFSFLFRGFVVGGVALFVLLLFLFCFSTAPQVTLFPSISSWLVSSDLY